MKNYIKIILLAILVATNNVGIAAENATVQFQIAFDSGHLSLHSVEKDGVAYTEIELGELTNSGEPGYPYLPIKEFKVSVPADASNITVAATVLKKEKFVLPNPPMPAQYPALSSVDYVEPAFVHLTSQFSSKSSDLPTSATLNEVMTVGGFNKVASILVSPVMWDESDNTIEICTEATISVSWNTDAEELNNLIVPYFQEAKDIAIKNTKDVVVNPDDVDKNSLVSLTHASMIRSVSERGQEYVPYIIVTTQKLASSLERLAAFRRLRGFQTKIYCIEEILADPMFSDGDVISGINDDAGKLRAFITYAYNTFGSQYFLLAGEYPQIPGRWATYSSEDYVCDQYFRDLTTKWVIPSTNYTRPNSLSSISQDVCGGRIGLRNSQELNDYIDKLIQYEFNLKNIDLSYLGNAFVLCCYDKNMHTAYDNYSQKYYQQYFDNLHELRVPEITERIVTGKEALSEMKSNYWGFVDWRAHGNYGSVCTSMQPKVWAYGITGLDSEKSGLEIESPNGLDNWGNNDYFCWTLSMSCGLAEVGHNREKYTFAESFILGKDYGGVSFIGNSGPGLIYSSSMLIQKMMEEVNDCYDSKLEIAYTGKIFSNGIRKSSVTDKHVKSTIGITGDPLSVLWLKQPVKSDNGDRFNPLNISNFESVNYAKYFYELNLTETGYDEIKEYTDINETLNCTLLNSRPDMLPYIHPTRISSLNVCKNGYWFTGKTIFSSIGEQAAIQVSDNSKLSIEALGRVEINGKLAIDAGSRLNIISHKPLLMNNCNIDSNGYLNVEAHRNVEIGEGTTIKKGVTMEIKNIK